MGIDWLDASLVSLSMSVDCMTIGATDGIKYPDLKKRRLFLLTFFFGFFQWMMPTIGYFIFYLVVQFGFSEEITNKLETFIPWIAFALLCFLGIKNIVEWVKDYLEEKKKKEEGTMEDEEGKPEKEDKGLTLPVILLQAVATSIDALCIGFVYSPLKYSILQSQLIFLEIGVITMLASSITTLFGKQIGKYIIKWAGLIAGIVFIFTGTKILIESFI